MRLPLHVSATACDCHCMWLPLHVAVAAVCNETDEAPSLTRPMKPLQDISMTGHGR